jgi:murein DD-endopeptidase MepM/ murein hydrolase activator NlpD
MRHADGTFGRYYHSTRGGVLVTAADRVQRGDLIGRSGDTGASAGPHLHFDVTRSCPEWGCQTVPIAFSDTNENPLRAGSSYTALPARDDDAKQ